MMWVYTDSCNYGNWDDSSENSCITAANKHSEETAATVRVKVIGESTEVKCCNAAVCLCDVPICVSLI